MRKSCRPCENSATQKALSEFRGLRLRRAEKVTKIRSPRDYTEFPIEFSHLAGLDCTGKRTDGGGKTPIANRFLGLSRIGSGYLVRE
jgi:hypothetical protein